MLIFSLLDGWLHVFVYSLILITEEVVNNKKLFATSFFCEIFRPIHK